MVQERYKRSFDKRLRNNRQIIQPGDNVFLGVQRKYEKETRHKLATIGQGPIPVLSVDSSAKTVVNKRRDEAVENISGSRVALTPKTDKDSHSDKEIHIHLEIS